MEHPIEEDWKEIRKQGQGKFIWGGKWYISALFISLMIFVILWAVTNYSLKKDLIDAAVYFIAFVFIRATHRAFLWRSNEKKFKA